MSGKIKLLVVLLAVAVGYALLSSENDPVEVAIEE